MSSFGHSIRRSPRQRRLTTSVDPSTGPSHRAKLILISIKKRPSLLSRVNSRRLASPTNWPPLSVKAKHQVARTLCRSKKASSAIWRRERFGRCVRMGMIKTALMLKPKIWGLSHGLGRGRCQIWVWRRITLESPNGDLREESSTMKDYGYSNVLELRFLLVVLPLFPVKALSLTYAGKIILYVFHDAIQLAISAID